MFILQWTNTSPYSIPTEEICLQVFDGKLQLRSSAGDLLFWETDQKWVFRTNRIGRRQFKWVVLPPGYPRTLFLVNMYHRPNTIWEIWAGDGTTMSDRIGSLSIQRITNDKFDNWAPRTETCSYGGTNLFTWIYSELFHISTRNIDPLPLRSNQVENRLENGINVPAVNPLNFFQRLAVKLINSLPLIDVQPSSYRPVDITNAKLFKLTIEQIVQRVGYRMLQVDNNTLVIDLLYLSKYPVRKAFFRYGGKVHLNSLLEIVRLFLSDGTEVPVVDIFGLRQFACSFILELVLVRHATQIHLGAGNNLSIEFDSLDSEQGRFMRLFTQNVSRLNSKAVDILLSQGGYFDRLFDLTHSGLLQLVEDGKQMPRWGNSNDLVSHFQQCLLLVDQAEGERIQGILRYHEILVELLIEVNVPIRWAEEILLCTLIHTFENESVSALTGRLWKVGVSVNSNIDQQLDLVGYLSTYYLNSNLGSDFRSYLPSDTLEILNRKLDEISKVIQVFDLTLTNITLTADV